MARKTLPKEILVYQCDTTEDGTPVYAAAVNVEEIPEDESGKRIGIYVLHREAVYVVHRELK